MTSASTSFRVVPLDRDLLAASVRLCAGSLERTAARVGAPWLSPPGPAERCVEAMLRRFIDAVEDGRLGLVVVDPVGGDVRAFLGATITELTPEDWRFTFMPPRSISIPASACHAESEAAAVTCYPLLLDALRQVAADRGIPRVIVQSAPMDKAGAAIWHQLGLLPDARMAVRPVDTWQPTGPPPPRITIRVATLDDLEALTDLAIEEHLYHAHNTAAGTSPDQPRATSRRLAAEAIADTDGSYQLVAEQAEPAGGPATVVACAVGKIMELDGEQIQRYFLPARYGYIGLTSVTAAARGQGVGRALVDALMRWFAERQTTVAFLHYVVDNPLSSAFWVRRGFAPYIEISTLRR